MTPPSLPKTILALGIALLFLVLLVLILLLTDIGFRVNEHLEQAPRWFSLLYLLLIGVVALPFGFWIWRLLSPKMRVATSTTPPPSRESIDERLERARIAGVETVEADATIATLKADREAGVIRIALFGEISSGKSTLVAGLLPEAEIVTDVTGGSTQTIETYQWTSGAGDQLLLVDMPGLNEVGESRTIQAREEALRAHIVVYLCSGDLTRDQQQELDSLLELDKPTLLALNKIDRYQPDEVEQIKNRLTQHNSKVEAVVTIRTGGEQLVIKQLPDGTETQERRPQSPQLDDLKLALQRLIDSDPEILDQLRDLSLFSLISRQLNNAEAEHRSTQAKRIVNSYTKKAVFGALAAVTPGSDLVIQGYLGTRMVKELSALYDYPLRKIDSELLLELAQKHLAKKHTLILALSGNALKAFPGIGTLSGGVLHAIAYGLIFDSLGRAVAESLNTRGELHPLPTVSIFKEYLGEDLGPTAQRLAKLVATQKQNGNDNS